MANPEQLAILERGVETWNQWRAGMPRSNEELTGPILLTDWRPNLSGANLSDADFQKADLSYVNLSRAQLIRTNLRGTNLREAWLEEAQMARADLGEANLYCADLSGADLRWAELTGVRLNGAKLFGADLAHANLRGADLSYVNLKRVLLLDADLSGAKLTGANLFKADLSGARLNGAELTGALVGKTRFDNNDLRHAIGLGAVRHAGPSTIDIHTIYRSGGQLPESFLRGCGVPEEFITYIRSLITRPIQFHSCFISYSSKDQEFAERLHADLQSKGVRCWFAPEDLKIGDPFRQRIDEAIRLRDKVLIVLSGHSVESAWVETEVETAFEEERGRKATLLFPIRLDDAVMNTDQAWAADIRRTRHIGDFRQWKNHAAYQNAFERLLRDLNAEGTQAAKD